MSLPTVSSPPKIALGGEPALILDVVKTGLICLATFLPQLNLSMEVQTWIIAVVVAGFGVVKGMATHPFPVTALTDAIVAVGVLCIGLGVNISQDALGSLVVLVTAGLVAIQRGQITPVSKPTTGTGIPDHA